MRRWLSVLDDLVLVAVLAAGGWWGYRFVDDGDVRAAARSAGSRPGVAVLVPPEHRTAAEALASLTVKGRAPKTGYDRRVFGSGWLDVDRNGCDTRNDMLRRDLSGVVVKPGTHGCVVTSGSLRDPYTGETVAFVKGNKTSTAVQIDHVVALSDAWQKGAQSWNAATRERFANDPLNLRTVSGAVNQKKGDGDAATWLPPDRSHWCDYVARQVAVKAKYSLAVTAAERDRIASILESCPGHMLPAR